MAFKIASLFNVAIEEVFIHDAKNSMQTVAQQVKNFFGLEFGFERFTQKAIDALNFARNEATRSNNSQVKPEHLLAGLLANPTTASARLLQANGVALEIEIHGDSFEFRENPKFTRQSKFVLELALQVVRLQGNKSIGTEHLLWGLVQLVQTDNTILHELFPPDEINLVALNNQLADIV
ncbi:MAG: transcriptional regulator [Symploca sp. SIO2C1]|nr:transcriptional regulator [Symploca sp. SIO2C1]